MGDDERPEERVAHEVMAKGFWIDRPVRPRRRGDRLRHPSASDGSNPQITQACFEALRAQYQEEAKALPNLNETPGAHGTIDPHMQRPGAAVALGLLPPEPAVYIYRDYGLKGSECYQATYSKPVSRTEAPFHL
jgi:hypothetical protein